MSSDRQSDRHGQPDGFAEFTEELRLLAEVLLARVEPVLRRTAADGQADLGGCAWCPVCAAAALVRGDHHDVVAALAEHGTSMVTVLREALAGVPVEPVLPPEWAEHAAGHHDSHEAWGHTGAGGASTPDHPGEPSTPAAESGRRHHAATSTGASPTASSAARPAGASAATSTGTHAESSTGPGRPHRTGAAHADPAMAPSADRATGTAAQPDHSDNPGRSRLRWGSTRPDQAAAPRPRRVDEYAAPRQQGSPAGTGMGPHVPADPATPSGTGLFATPPTEDADDHSRTTRVPRSRYVDIPVTIRG
ncbi:hypothetical protein ACFU44_24475 [Nocardia rhizosphaerihabitans]|uniref:hypothetical protein n=1 Tax=Nocardia rhizosphaerihabitans TaxID=1691570 RepID=UPI00366B97FF